jgi:predicted transcriptional regulator
MSLGIVDKDVLLRHINKSMTLEELTRIVRGDKSTVFRSLQKLVGQGICIANQDNEGGYSY